MLWWTTGSSSVGLLSLYRQSSEMRQSSIHIAAAAEWRYLIENLKKAGVPAEIDIYPGLYHAFDMLTPWRRAGRLAAKRFEKRFLYAQKNFFAKNDD